MNLLKYLEQMKNIPERFSNLAFWRGVRNLKDCVVNAFEYVNSWGESIESEIANSGMKIIKTDALTNDMVTYHPNDKTSYVDIELTNVTNIPTNAKLAILNFYLVVRVGNSASYTFECRGVTPVSDAHIIYKFYRAISPRTLEINAQPTYELIQSHIWYYG